MQISNAAPELRFIKGHVYFRKRDIHPHFGGSRQSGISSSAQVPAVFVFTGESGEQYGYRDEFDEEGVFSYTGEGQVGNMRLAAGNAAIANHAALGKALHVFRSLGKGKGCKYLGEFTCAGYVWKRGPDRKKEERDIIVFRLVPVDLTHEEPDQGDHTPPPTSLAEARSLAIKATKSAVEAEPGSSVRRLYRRSEQVRRYVLMRADGKCESCRLPAPFMRKDGSPYLEPHHINRLSDGGLDHPRYVAAICPACHREIHHGKHGHIKNESLRDFIAAIEPNTPA